MLIVALIVSIGGIALNGGISNLNASLADISPGLLTATNGGKLSILFILGVFIGMATAVSSSLYYHRIAYAAKSRRIAGSTYGFTAIIMMLFYVGLVIGGISARVLAPDLSDPEFALPTLTKFLPPIAGAFVAAGIIAALHSTIDNQLLSAGVMGSHDIYQKLIRPTASEKQVLVASRIATTITGVGALLIALWNPALIINIYTIVVVFTVPCALFPLLVLAMYWRRTTKEAAIIGSLFGCVGAILWYFFGTYPATLVIMPITFVMMIVISLVTKRPSATALSSFFE
jgi:Na+/proline symporter